MNIPSERSLPASRSGAARPPPLPSWIRRLVLLGAALLFGLAGEAAAEWQHTVIKHLPPSLGYHPNASLVTGTDGRLYGTTAGRSVFGDFGTIFVVNADGTEFATLHSFTNDDAFYPNGLVVGADGRLYGTTVGGGPAGTVFAINPDGTGFTRLHSFAWSDGAYPHAGLTVGPDGRLYGTTGSGGAFSRGTVFAIIPDGTGFTTLHSFTGVDGDTPDARVTIGTDGRIYGTTAYGGTTNGGTVFAMNADGSGFTTLHSFDGSVGAKVPGALTVGPDSRLYGTTYFGGTSNRGTVFAINANGTAFTTLHAFAESDGASPGELTTGADGQLYGTTAYGGATEAGTIFTINADGTGFTTLHAFTGGIDGAYPYAGLTVGTDGRLYGAAASGGEFGHIWSGGYGTVFALNADGTAFTTLHSFAGTIDGAFPYAGLTVGADGRLYGTTAYGGSSEGYGALFAINADGTQLTTLHSFDLYDGFPLGGLTPGSDGRLYGTTAGGGEGGAWGTVFAINADGTGFTTLHSFAWSDGAAPSASLTLGADGRLYGTTSNGGPLGEYYDPSTDHGTIFAMNADGTGFVTLHAFAGNDGSYSYASLTTGADGRLYGTTSRGGASGYGTVFAINADGTQFTTLHSFGGSDGASPYAGITIGADGRLYGTTSSGGASGLGTVYAINADATGFTTLRSFAGSDGARPHASLTIGADGRLYGTTSEGGASGDYGTVYVINPDGTGFTTLHSFAGSDGDRPYAGLTLGAEGQLYGTTWEGGRFGRGTLFSIEDVTPFAVTITTPEPGHLRPVKQSITFNGTFSPTGAPGTYTAKWTFTSDLLAAPIEKPGIVTGTNVSCTQAFSKPGVYAVTLTVTDPAGVSASTALVGGNSGTKALVVIYDPTGGSLTGSGWISSPAGAFLLDPSQAGRVHVHVVAKYKKGATVPHGNIDFQFKAGGLKFASSRYQWLVVSGSNAKLKGTGTVNGEDGFGILLTTKDGGRAGPDKLRIKIWDLETGEVIYDNQRGTADNAPLGASTALKGGNLTVHAK